jgi:hypothetical protein
VFGTTIRLLEGGASGLVDVHDHQCLAKGPQGGDIAVRTT